MNLSSFLAKNPLLLTKLNIKSEDVQYCIKLADVTSRVTQSAPIGIFSGLKTGISNAVSDATAQNLRNSYLVKLNNGIIYLITDKAKIESFDPKTAVIETVILESDIRSTVYFSNCSVESAVLTITAENFEETFFGELSDFIKDFDKNSKFPLDKISPAFATIKTAERMSVPGKLSAFKNVSTVKSLVAYDDGGIYLYNKKLKIDFANVLAYYSRSGYSQMLYNMGGNIQLIEIIEDDSAKTSTLENNLITYGAENKEEVPHINFPENIIKADEFLSVYGVFSLVLVTVDNLVYLFNNNNLVRCGLFQTGADIIAKTADGQIFRFNNCSSVLEIFPSLPSSSDELFMEEDKAQPFIVDGEIKRGIVSEAGILFELMMYDFTKMEKFRYKTTAYSCEIAFVYNTEPIVMKTANSLGIHIGKLQEKVATQKIIGEYTTDKLYRHCVEREAKKILAGYIGEIFKTDILLNLDSDINTTIKSIRMIEGDVLRGMTTSFVGKIKNIEDMQSDLMQKVSLIELQRKKVQKTSDEWYVYYPHVAAMEQEEWLKEIFGDFVDQEFLDSQYWTSVNLYKKIFGSASSYLQKSLTEIAHCTSYLQGAIPDAVARADLTESLRITSTNESEVIASNVNVAKVIAKGIETATSVVRGVATANPLTVVSSAKNIVNTYTDDVVQRKNIKTYGVQVLEWWLVMMKGLRVQLFEIENEILNYNKACLKRDMAILSKMPDEQRTVCEEKLRLQLKEKIMEDISDRYFELLPQYNFRILDVIEIIDSYICKRSETVKKFKKNLFM